MFPRRPSDSKIDIFRALDSFGSYLKCPRDDESIGNPIAISTMTKRTIQFGISRNGKSASRSCDDPSQTA
jgi:hypothetical protein